MTPRIARTVLQRRRMPDPRRAPKHKALVKQLPCLLAGPECVGPIDAHHLMRVAGEGPKGMGRTHADRWLIPLCRFGHHRVGKHSVHAHGDDEACLAARGIQARDVAEALWKYSGDIPAMQRVIFRARQRA